MVLNEFLKVSQGFPKYIEVFESSQKFPSETLQKLTWNLPELDQKYSNSWISMNYGESTNGKYHYKLYQFAHKSTICKYANILIASGNTWGSPGNCLELPSK